MGLTVFGVARYTYTHHTHIGSRPGSRLAGIRIEIAGFRDRGDLAKDALSGAIIGAAGFFVMSYHLTEGGEARGLRSPISSASQFVAGNLGFRSSIDWEDGHGPEAIEGRFTVQGVVSEGP